MTTWINVSDQLPKDGQLVLIETNEDNLIYTNEYGKDALWKHHVAIFREGKVPDEDDDIEFADQHGNNEVPYAWDGTSGDEWFGQDVVRWMPIPE